MGCADDQVTVGDQQRRRREVRTVDMYLVEAAVYLPAEDAAEAYRAVAEVLEDAFGPNPDASAFARVSKLAA
jgi:hypothetical protein